MTDYWHMEKIKKKIKANPNNSLLYATKKLEKHYKIYIEGHQEPISRMVISNNNKYIVTCSLSENTIRIWNLLKNRQIANLKGHSEGIKTLKITNDDKYIISGSYDNTIRVWNFLEKKEEFIIKDYIESRNVLKISKDNKYIIYGSNEWKIKIWNFFKKSFLKDICIK